MKLSNREQTRHAMNCLANGRKNSVTEAPNGKTIQTDFVDDSVSASRGLRCRYRIVRTNNRR